ncbi:type I methionyl aminopeptidase [Candidatus Falkowbacteria bacterium CG10_big_fil_rev_8_21_14_0_10_37_14]|uniref:Methionine aminopeptidase n=1 Tax=Candidatus Falkowbacteria bacterium CG10_big_fil_rev_8_21_14_0_10_37_14 TaxID=1974561 RepID=A0A2M6WU28_9BACT|nr:type I methionyl aminopeptidase [Candidatus Falkowbacteria bacterium]PIT96226.1 MAG: type I methionyl aminopeptidase [Candidatus Falkowbacteria bacterium CG10_big_fil_rev_8_21_14_0_10_37_14]
MSKYIKTLEQIEGIRKSCHEMAVIFDKLIPLVKPGLDIGDLESVACKLIAEVGGRPAFKGYKTHKSAVPFPSALCVSVNNEIVHGVAIPGRILYNGDIVGVDVGMELGGYYSDMARTLPVGEISPKAQKLLEVTERALYLGIDQMKAGNTLDDVGLAIQRFVEPNGFSVVRELVGHGVGLDVHEEPQVPHYGIKEAGLPNVRLQAGMVLALEPMVNEGDWHIKLGKDGFAFVTKDGKLSAHFENTVLITEEGPEILTM